jgi:hypothetical protein
MQNYYAKNAIGRVSIANLEKHTITDVDVAFFQAGFMDSQTRALAIPEMAPGEIRVVEIFALFNEEVFRTEGITPCTGEIIVDYKSRGKAAQQKFPVSYDLHDKTALTWDDDRKLGAFITPADSALRNYASFVRQVCKGQTISGCSEALQIGMQLYCALNELGCIYQIDPTSPFTAAQDNPLIVDSISLPRDTLKRTTGDCDDLTVLYCSLLETVGIETAFITVPGHILPAFNTKVPSREYKTLHPEKDMSLNVKGELWVPVEITLVGTGSFLDAWRQGIEVYNSSGTGRGFILTHDAQEVFRPVGLRETDLGLQYGNREAIAKRFRDSVGILVDRILESFAAAAQESGEKWNYNKLGIACAQFGRLPQAEKAFNTALSLDRNYLNAKVNLGNVYYMRSEYQEALRRYHGVEKSLQDHDRKESSLYKNVLLNISKTYYELENFDKSSEYFKRLSEIDPQYSKDFAYLRGADDEGGRRSADFGALRDVVYADEE